MLTNVHAGTMIGVRKLVGKANCFDTHTTELIGYSEAAENSACLDACDDKLSARRGKTRIRTNHPRVSAEVLA